MKFPTWIKVYGDAGFRGDGPRESAEHVTVFAELRRRHPDTYGVIALHPKNEANRYKHQALTDHVNGMSPGAPDIIIPGAPTFCCELKRVDHTKSAWSKHQLAWLKAAHDAGAFVCVALGWHAAIEAFEDWLELQ